VIERLVESGDAVTAGAPLLRVDATRLALAVEEARANVSARKVDLAEAARELARGEQLAEGNTISKSRFDSLGFGVERAESALALARVNLATAERALQDASIRAPFDGTVEEVRVDVGDYLAPGTPVAVMVDLSRARVRAGVTAAEARGLAPGGTVTAVFEDLGAREMQGTIRSVGRLADPGTGTYTVEVWIDDPRGELRDGMVARVLLPRAEHDPQPVVPRAALLRRQGLTALFVVEDGVARARSVRVGRSSEDLVEILEGVSVGEEVVVDGLFALRDGAAVSVEGAAAAP
jgi:membrane fusion protein (multidrug efflux system)